MKIYCISEGELYSVENGKAKNINCQRISGYIETIQKMRLRDEWKTKGKGAQFMGVEQKNYGDMTAHGEPLLRSVCACGGRLLYTTFIDGMGGMYLKNVDDAGDETYVFANKEYDLTGVYSDGEKCVLTAALGFYERHLGVANLKNGDIIQITEGFTSETHPFISKTDNRKILYTAMGYARDGHGNVVEKSPCSICCYDESTGELSELIEDSEYDYIKPSDDNEGNLYYIKRRYEQYKKESNLFYDIIMFPVRIIKAIGGFLSVFSMAFGGEPLRTGGKNPAKNKSKDERSVFVEGNMIRARRQQENTSEEGIIPSGWELIKRSGGVETVIKRGVMDYRITDEGDIVYSDGAAVRILKKDGKDERLCKLSLANSITLI